MFLQYIIDSEKRTTFLYSVIVILVLLGFLIYIKEIVSYKEDIIKERTEYLKKIENYYIIEKNPNKELLLEELQEKDLDFLKNYYFEMLEKKI